MRRKQVLNADRQPQRSLTEHPHVRDLTGDKFRDDISRAPVGRDTYTPLYKLLFVDPQRPANSGLRALLFAAWAITTIVLLSYHAFWRDEVRALSYALQGDSVYSMVRLLHGEGHPAVWYLLLRAAHSIVPLPQVLPAMSVLVAVCAVWLLVFHSPFRAPVIALALSTYFIAYEYSVMARNYGISMLLMFAFAALYDRWRDRGVLLGMILLLLANTNTYSVLLTAALLGFWLLDILFVTGLRWSRSLSVFALNALLGAAGAALCWLTVSPLINDSAVIAHPYGIHVTDVLQDAALPGKQFDQLLLHLYDSVGPYTFGYWYGPPLDAAMSVVLFGATLGLLPRPAALIGALASLASFSIFFGVVSPGSYRHQALWLAFLISLYWIVGRSAARVTDPTVARDPFLLRLVPLLGILAFLGLLAAQVPRTAEMVARPGNESRSTEFSALMKATPRLDHAILLAEPDYLLEAVPYFLPNDTYLLREHRFGRIPIFTKAAQLTLTLDDILGAARELHARTQRPIVILLQDRLDERHPERTYFKGYNWKLVTTGPMVASFLAATHRIASFPPALSDESFDVYTLD